MFDKGTLLKHGCHSYLRGEASEMELLTARETALGLSLLKKSGERTLLPHIPGDMEPVSDLRPLKATFPGEIFSGVSIKLLEKNRRWLLGQGPKISQKGKVLQSRGFFFFFISSSID